MTNGQTPPPPPPKPKKQPRKGSKENPFRLKEGESFRGGKVVKEKEFQLARGAELTKQLQESKRPKATRATIILDPQGKQVASAVFRGGRIDRETGRPVLGTETEVDLTRVGRKTTRVQGVPQFVSQEASSFVSTLPRAAAPPSAGIGRAQAAVQRVEEIDRQLQSGLVRADAGDRLIAERERQLVIARGAGMAPPQQPVPGEFAGQGPILEGQISQPPFQEGQVSFPPEDRVAQLVSVTPKNRFRRTLQQSNQAIGAFAKSLLTGKVQIPDTPVARAQFKEDQRKAVALEKWFPLLKGAPSSITGITFEQFRAQGVAGQSPFGGLVPTGKLAAAPKAIRAFAQTGLGQRLGRGAVFFAAGGAVQEAVPTVTRLTAKQEQKEVSKILKSKGTSIRKITSAGLRAQERAVAELPGGLPVEVFGRPIRITPRGLAVGLPGGTLLPLKGREAFEQTVRQELTTAGLKGDQLEAGVEFARRQRVGRGVGEIGGALAVETGAESLGRFGVRQAFLSAGTKVIPEKKIGIQLFKQTFGPIGAAGVFEGAGGEILQRRARGQEQSLAGTALAGATGGIFAGFLGGTIAGTSVRRPITSKVLRVGAAIADPLEKPGDIAQDVLERVGKQFKRRTLLDPVVRTTEGGFKLGLGGKARTTLFERFGLKQRPGKVITPSIQAQFQPPEPPGPKTLSQLVTFAEKQEKAVQTRARTRADNIRKAQEDIFGKRTPDGVVVPTPTDTRIGTFGGRQQRSRTNIEQSVDKNIKAADKQFQETNVFSPTNIFSSTFVPTSTPLPRIPPPLPLALPGFGSGQGTRSGKGVKFVNELAFGRQVLGGALGTGRRAPTSKQVKMDRKRDKGNMALVNNLIGGRNAKKRKKR